MSPLATTVSRSRATLKRCVFLLGPGTKRKWLSLIALAMFVSAIEAVSAVLVFVLLALLVAPSSEVSVPVFGDLNDSFPALSEPGGLLPVIFIATAFFSLRGGIYLLQSYLQNRLAYETGSSLARRLVRGYLGMPYSVFIRRNSAELIRNAHESTLALAAQVLLPGIALTGELFVSLALCAVLLAASPLVAGGALLFLGVLVLILLKSVQPRLLRMGRSVQELTISSLHSLQQTLMGFRDIRVLGKEKFFEEHFVQTRSRLADRYAVRGLLVDIPRIALETSVLFVVLGFIGIQVIRDQSVGESTTILGLFGYVAFRILPSVNRIVNTLQSLKFAAPLIDFLYEDARAADAIPPATSPATAWAPFDSLEMRNVSYRYPAAEENALADLSFQLRSGQWVGIVGKTGSGKSTLLDLVLGLLEPTSGEIFINGTPLLGSQRDWQHRVGFVPQTVFMLDDTIRQNVALGLNTNDIDDASVWEALEIAQLRDVVERSPQGLDTMIGERGVKFSGGQRQRLAIARAMYRRPEVLVFDEGTSALDSKTEAEVMTALSSRRAGLTMVTVAHRISTIRDCDLLILLVDGELGASGTYRDLLNESEQFREIARETDPRGDA